MMTFCKSYKVKLVSLQRHPVLCDDCDAPPGAGTSRHRHAAFQRGGKGVVVGSKVIVGKGM